MCRTIFRRPADIDGIQPKIWLSNITFHDDGPRKRLPKFDIPGAQLSLDPLPRGLFSVRTHENGDGNTPQQQVSKQDEDDAG